MDEVVVIDFETASEADIKLGAWAYSKHPSTHVLCASVRVAPKKGDDTVLEWRFGDPPLDLPDIAYGTALVAHNVGFERSILANVLDWPDTAHTPWWDTAVMAQALNLPRSLEGVAAVLGLEQQKDTEGGALMRRAARGEELTTAEFDRLVEYCHHDTKATAQAFWAMWPQIKRVPPTERLLMAVADPAINARGVCVDTQLAATMSRFVAERRQMLDLSMDVLTDGDVSTATNARALSSWLDDRVELPVVKRPNGTKSKSAGRDVLVDLIKDDGTEPLVHSVATIRTEASRVTSLGKLARVNQLADEVRRVRWILNPYGAHTGRWTSSVLQLHNLRKDHRETDHRDTMIRLVEAGDPERFVDVCELVYGTVPLDELSQSLRALIVAPPGHDLIGADYSAIEARVLAWLAKQEDVLEIFQAGEDIYMADARAIGSEDRQLGKVQRLALGFGMGAIRFCDTGAKAGIHLSLKEWNDIKQGWRENNPRIVRLWYKLDEAFRTVVEDRKAEVEVGRCLVHGDAQSVQIRLPSGRNLFYWRPELKTRKKTFETVGEDGKIQRETKEVEVVVFQQPAKSAKGMAPVETYGGKLVENITQAVARDLLADFIVRLRDHPTYRLVMHVHDSAIAEVLEGQGSVEEFETYMTIKPEWALGLPIAAEGYRSKRFQG